MKLLFIILNSAENLEEVLEGLLEVGVTGATVVDSVGMGHIIEDVPLFAGHAQRVSLRKAPQQHDIFRHQRQPGRGGIGSPRQDPGMFAG